MFENVQDRTGVWHEGKMHRACPKTLAIDDTFLDKEMLPKWHTNTLLPLFRWRLVVRMFPGLQNLSSDALWAWRVYGPPVFDEHCPEFRPPVLRYILSVTAIPTPLLLYTGHPACEWAGSMPLFLILHPNQSLIEAQGQPRLYSSHLAISIFQYFRGFLRSPPSYPPSKSSGPNPKTAKMEHSREVQEHLHGLSPATKAPQPLAEVRTSRPNGDPWWLGRGVEGKGRP